MTRLDRVLVVAAAALLLAGCGGEDGEPTESSSSPPAASATQAPSEMPDAQQGPDALVIGVSIEGGDVNPTNESLRATVGQPIVIRVDSDAADELHVHSTPEHTFPVAVGPGQSFQFTVEMPGRVDIELHELGKTIATIQVQ